jgi:hypothetical protein
MDRDETETTRATAGLPGLHFEVTQRRAADGDAEQTSVNLSFAAFGRACEAANPFTLGAQSAQAAWLATWLARWLPWLEAARMMGLQSTLPWAIATGTAAAARR